MNGWLPILIAFGIAMGATAWTVWAWRWKADRGDHRLARMYHHHDRLQGWPYRNGAAMIPIAAGWAWLSGIGLLMNEMAPVLAEDLTWLAMLVGLPLFILTFWSLIRPAAWMLPPWLAEARRREKAGLPPNVPVPPEGDRPVMTRRTLMLSVIGYAVFVIVWWRLELPLHYLLIGLGASIPILMATRIKG